MWPNFYAWSNYQSVAQFLNVIHFSKCYRFYVLPRTPSKCNPLFTFCPFLQLYDLFFFGWPRHTCYLCFKNFVDFWGKGKGIPQDPGENLDILESAKPRRADSQQTCNSFASLRLSQISPILGDYLSPWGKSWQFRMGQYLTYRPAASLQVICKR